MYGFEAISAYNGWSMSIVGILIVFSGLVILSITISRIHKVLYFFDKKKETQPKTKLIKRPEYILPQDIKSLSYYYKQLTDQLEEPFQLSDLIKISQKFDFPHPYLSINYLRNAGIIVPQGECLFALSYETGTTNFK